MVFICLFLCAVIAIPIVLVLTFKKSHSTERTPTKIKRISSKVDKKEAQKIAELNAFWDSFYNDDVKVFKKKYIENTFRERLKEKFSMTKYYDDLIKMKIDKCKGIMKGFEINNEFVLDGKSYTYDANEKKVMDENKKESMFNLSNYDYHFLINIEKRTLKSDDEKNEWLVPLRRLCIVYKEEHKSYVALHEKLENVDEDYSSNDSVITLSFLRFLRGCEMKSEVCLWIFPETLILYKSKADGDIRYNFDTYKTTNHAEDHFLKKFSNKDNILFVNNSSRANLEQYDKTIASWNQYLKCTGQFLRWLIFSKRRFKDVNSKYKIENHEFLTDTKLQTVKVYEALIESKFDTFQKYIDYFNKPPNSEQQENIKRWKNLCKVDPKE